MVVTIVQSQCTEMIDGEIPKTCEVPLITKMWKLMVPITQSRRQHTALPDGGTGAASTCYTV